MPDFELDDAAERRMGSFFDRIGDVLRNKRRRASFAMYALGLLGEGDRKSAEPIAARACGDPSLCDAYHARLLHFLADSVWDDHGVRRAATEYAIGVLVERGEPITAWIIDDTGFLKQGKHSVGVQRQYTGSAGKITNCQIGVSLSVATRSEHLPLDFELYLPKSWTDDPKRRLEAKIPDEVAFKTKIDLSLQMIERAARDGVPGSILLADSAYGDSSDFRRTVRILGLDYGVGIHGPTKVWRVDKRLRRNGPAISALDLALAIGVKGFRRCTWREGTKGRLSSRFALRRVVAAHDDGTDPAQREDEWLLMEWPDDEPKPTKFFLVTLPRSASRKQIVRIVKERYRTERLYEDLKGELGLDHFEGRSFPGWHHHVSVALSCYAFVLSERVRRFPPSTRGSLADDPLQLAA
jgi:SRSO17 transposase